jgi:hypothetical protein
LNRCGQVEINLCFGKIPQDTDNRKTTYWMYSHYNHPDVIFSAPPKSKEHWKHDGNNALYRQVCKLQELKMKNTVGAEEVEAEHDDGSKSMEQNEGNKKNDDNDNCLQRGRESYQKMSSGKKNKNQEDEHRRKIVFPEDLDEENAEPSKEEGNGPLHT